MTDIHLPDNLADTPEILADSKDTSSSAEAEQTLTALVYPAKPGGKPRRFKASDDIDTEYAAEFEDAFYGEGM